MELRTYVANNADVTTLRTGASVLGKMTQLGGKQEQGWQNIRSAKKIANLKGFNYFTAFLFRL